ncbi:MAG TPA: IPT/TIG domain-containing protein [Vicinamibacterales bacterium]
MHIQRSTITRPGLLLAVLLLALFAVRALPAYAAQPTVTNLTDDTGSVLGGETVVITGTNFNTPAVSEVKFGSEDALDFIVNNDTTITATAPPSAGLASGSVDVTVTNATGTSANTAADTYNYEEPDPPTVTSVSPTGGPITGGTSVTITGTNFVAEDPANDIEVEFGSTPATNFIVQNSTTIVATSPAHAAGTVQVRVTTPFGISANTAADNFIYGAVAPTVTAVTPPGGSVDGGNLVVLTGTGFTGITGAAGVTFGGTNATSYTVNGDTQITAIAPAHAAGTVNVIVTHPTNGASVNTVGDDYTFGAAPTITSVSPGSGTTAGGTSVVITGTGFTGTTGAASVTFGGTNAASYTVNSDTQITATTPAHAAGTVDVVVTTPVGATANTAADNFIYTAGPTVTDVAPSSGSTAGGTIVVITGTGFTGATAVTFGGTAATTFTVNGATQITATAPAKAAGTVDILVTTPAGTSPNTPDDNFLYGTGPSITSISPAQGPVAGGTTVTITGTGFTGATAVMFGSTAATSFTVASDTSITAVSPAGANGVVRISVVTPLGTSADTAADNFTYGTGATVTFTLFFRWTLIVWSGKAGADITAALKGLESPDNPATNDVSGIVTAVYHFNNAQQRYEAWFPGSANVPGANDISTFVQGQGYWIAISAQGQTNWTVPTD